MHAADDPPVVSFVIDRYSTRATVDCTLQPFGLPYFLEALLGRSSVFCNSLAELNIEHNGSAHPNDTEADINLCQIYHILSLLPALNTLRIRGMVFVPCDLNGHGPGIYHTPRPPSPRLKALHLTNIAVRYPFGVDPLHLTTIAPAVDSLYMSDWWALPHPRRVGPIEMALRHPHAEFGPALTVERSLANFEVIFPNQADRQRFQATEKWLDFTKRLPSRRGTRNLALKDIDGVDVSTVVSIIAEDAVTLETLTLSFAAQFQSMLPSCPHWLRSPNG